MIEYLNNREKCIVCFQPPEPDFALIKHHVTYFPEKIAFVHYDCHKKIHDPDNPMTQWIQYTEEEKRKHLLEQAEEFHIVYAQHH